LSAINLNDELMIVTDKIHNEAPNQSLSTEAQSFQSVRAQRKPQPRLGIRHLLTQGFGTAAMKRRNCAVSGVFATPLPASFARRPPPQGGR
jgi:hypothetical protein